MKTLNALIFKTVFTLSVALLLFAGQAQAQCTVAVGSPITIDNTNNGQFTHPFQGCTEINIYGTLNIANNFNLTHLGAIKINIIGPDAKLAITSNNTTLTLAQNSSIIISNGGEIVQTSPCTNNRRIVVGTVAYAACTGGGNVDYTFTDLTNAGGSIRGGIRASATDVCEEEDFSLSVYSLGLNTMERQFILTKVTPSGDSTVVYDSGNINAGDSVDATLDFSFAATESAFEYAEIGTYTFIIRAIDKNLSFFNDEKLEVVIHPGPTTGTSVGGTTESVNDFVCLNGEVTVELVDNVGDVQRWEREFSGTPGVWEEIANTTNLLVDADPKQTGTYTYRALVATGICDFEYSTTTEVIVNAPAAIAYDDETASCTVNANDWIHIFNASGEIIASINSFGQDLGSVTAGLQYNGGNAFKVTATGTCDGEQAVMNRVFSINPTTQPTTNVNVRLYFTQAELDGLTLLAGCGDPNGCANNDDVCGLTDVRITKISGGNRVLLYPSYGSDFGVHYAEVSVSSFSDFWLHGTPGGFPLPVEMLSFNATAANNHINLKWTTATEIDNDGFEIQRSANGIDFETIGWVNGNGNSIAKNDYSFNDFEAASGVNYYRLKQIDFDGQFEYSKIVSARMGADASISSLSVYPNPTKGDLYVEIEADNQSFSNIKIYNHMGQQVGNAEHQIVAGKNKLMVNTQNLISGTYFMMVESNEKIITTKFVVSK